MSCEPSGELRTVAFVQMASTTQPEDYPIAGTPSGEVVAGRSIAVTTPVHSAYPQDELLKKMGAGSCVSEPIVDPYQPVSSASSA